MRTVKNAIVYKSLQPVASEGQDYQVQVHMMLAVIIGPMEAHAQFVCTLVTVVRLQELSTDLFHVTQKNQVWRRPRSVVHLLDHLQPREVLDVPLRNALVVRGSSVSDVPEDDA